jgi:hypothetical protein
MKKNVAICLAVFSVALQLKSSSAPVAPTGELFGYVKDNISGQPLPFALVMIKSGEAVIGGAQTDEKGTYKISGIVPEIYTVEALYRNYGIISVREVLVSAEKTSRLDFNFSGNVDVDTVIVYDHIPLIDPQEVSSSFTLTEADLDRLPITDEKDLPALAPGVFQQDAGRPLYIRGSRGDANQYIVDGVKMYGKFDIPQGDIAQMTVLTGGIPAKYGDATGGVFFITTKSYYSHRGYCPAFEK